MSSTGSGACVPGPGHVSGSGSGASNPRKFSEKIALHTQRQAEETAAFQEVMMDITSTRVRHFQLLPGGRQALPGLVGLPYITPQPALSVPDALIVTASVGQFCPAPVTREPGVHLPNVVSAVSQH